ncbi:hypothetical protein ANCCAN_02547 [Ancylostoma caninum]|uniref:Uncharacterized protein n=1 Tax=Ancylostoma caninum TaxID=29170 RepID=A0A368H479_ANCCA|nr:hypothetical protein ANCCAN_02547 [Ancylostoma caninum]
MKILCILLAFLVLSTQGSDVSTDQGFEHGYGHGAVRIPVVAAAAPLYYHGGWGWGWGPWKNKKKKGRRSNKRRNIKRI